MQIPLFFRADLLAVHIVILEVKAIPGLLPAHEAQLQTYLRMSGLPVGLLMNFHAIRLKDGLKRSPHHSATSFAALRLAPCWRWRKNERARWCRSPQGQASHLTGDSFGLKCDCLGCEGCNLHQGVIATGGAPRNRRTGALPVPGSFGIRHTASG
jgi:hypothetical protein